MTGPLAGLTPSADALAVETELVADVLEQALAQVLDNYQADEVAGLAAVVREELLATYRLVVESLAVVRGGAK